MQAVGLKFLISIVEKKRIELEIKLLEVGIQNLLPR
jgi:hypothetical protein